jgi:hypothetical protein
MRSGWLVISECSRKRRCRYEITNHPNAHVRNSRILLSNAMVAGREISLCPRVPRRMLQLQSKPDVISRRGRLSQYLQYVVVRVHSLTQSRHFRLPWATSWQTEPTIEMWMPLQCQTDVSYLAPLTSSQNSSKKLSRQLSSQWEVIHNIFYYFQSQ